jgi:hypothetical protein
VQEGLPARHPVGLYPQLLLFQGNPQWVHCEKGYDTPDRVGRAPRETVPTGSRAFTRDRNTK